MESPLALIEFVIFIGFVVWLFTLGSSPFRRDRNRTDEGQSTGERGAPDD